MAGRTPRKGGTPTILMKAKKESFCRVCKGTITVGETIRWNAGKRGPNGVVGVARHYNCISKARQEPRPCKICGTMFVPNGPRRWYGTKTCDDRACAEKMHSKALSRRQKRKTPTKPERILRKLLDKAYGEGNVIYQHPVARYVLDAYVPSQKLCYEADGDYWHSLHPERDAKRDKRLLDEFGITTIRLSETELSKMKKLR